MSDLRVFVPRWLYDRLLEKNYFGSKEAQDQHVEILADWSPDYDYSRHAAPLLRSGAKVESLAQECHAAYLDSKRVPVVRTGT